MDASKIVILATLIGAVGSFVYLVEVVKGKIKPNRVSFILWALPPLISAYANIKNGGGMESLMTFSVGFFPLLIFLATFVNKKSVWKLTGFDFLCGALSLSGFVLWQVTKEGYLAILLSIISDFLAGIPTLVKTYKHPETELAWPWLMPVIGEILVLTTLKQVTFLNSGFMIYVTIFNTTIYLLTQSKIGKKWK